MVDKLRPLILSGNDLSPSPSLHPEETEVNPRTDSAIPLQLFISRGSILDRASITPLAPSAPISFSEFLGEMALGIPRGGLRMIHDTGEHPFIVLGTVGVVVGLSLLLPTRYALAFTRGSLVLGAGVSGVFMGNGWGAGYHAYRHNDRRALREASTEFGVGALSLGLSIGGVKLGERLAKSPNAALRWGLLGSILHSPDEIAAALAISRGASQVR